MTLAMFMKTFPQVLSYVFLLAVPFLVTALAFTFGHLSYAVYLPGWFLNILLMFFAFRKLGYKKEWETRRVAWPIITSWALISVFAGMGPPPSTAKAWVELALEQQVRYCILILSGTLTTVGLLRLHNMLTGNPGFRYAQIGKVAILVALPLFVANMIYWGFFITDVFTKYPNQGTAGKPAWLQTVSSCFTVVRLIEVSLIYLVTAAFAYAIKSSGKLNPTACRIYTLFSILGIILNILPNNLPEPLTTANYVSYIPAITLLMPYLMAVNLLKNQNT
ncbi:hypothetical protein [Dyadobacter frigoris]|uniref:hypothetical protein n=1 Tax=Dyadobacter frigoris TaxID=2576211 RepID=UPI00255670C6|nr:hypothetical protein [Dyadobacter frigoris]